MISYLDEEILVIPSLDPVIIIFFGTYRLYNPF